MKKQAYEYLQSAEHGAWLRAQSYVVINPTTGKHGLVKVAHPSRGEGKLQVFVWDTTGTEVQRGTASGYGYDKLSAALVGLKFDNLTFNDHPVNWEAQLRNAGYTVIQAM